MTTGAHEVVLVRHGETEWSRAGKHTGRTDVPLTERGQQQARAVGDALKRRRFALALTSPLARAVETCRRAGFGDIAAEREDLREWDYGAYEGRTTAEIRNDRPGWSLWRDGAPDGETAAQVGERADRVIAEARSVDGDVILFAHGHLLRVLDGSVARPGAERRTAVRARPGDDQHPRLRAGNARHPVVERACGGVTNCSGGAAADLEVDLGPPPQMLARARALTDDGVLPLGRPGLSDLADPAVGASNLCFRQRKWPFEHVRHDAHHRTEPDDGDWRVPGSDRPVAELSPEVVAPAPDRARSCKRAGVEAADCDRCDASGESGDANGTRASAGCPTPVSSVTELACITAAPAQDAARVRPRTRVAATGYDRGDACRQAEDIDGRVPVCLRSVPKLSVGVVAPALDPACVRERARMDVADLDRVHAVSKAGNIDRRMSLLRRAVAELTVLVVPPALDSANACEGARAADSGRDRRDAAGSPDTSTGVVRSVVVPSPSCPKLFRPQHLTPPVSVSAHVWEPPAAIAATPLASPET